MDSYDAIPYESTPFHETHPAFLAPLGRLFGLAPADPHRCRVLEIGCASGGNLIPMASHLPNSEFLGIELSESQAAAGRRLVEAIGLSNITIRSADILTFEEWGDPFDYVIVHGVYSWVPRPVRERILSLCSRHLAPDGIAYISYNTLPGWRMRGMLRDMLLHHVRHETAPRARLAAGHDLLDFLEQATTDLGALSAHYLRYEIQRIRGNHTSYLYHEYLEETNEAFLFSTFAADARRVGLQYVCETELHTLFPSTLGERAESLLERFDDPLERWQYMDFLSNRNFRQSLLCRGERTISREPDLDRFTTFAFAADLEPPRKLDLRRPKGAPFSTGDGERHEVYHPLTKAALAHLHAVYPDSVAFGELHGVAAKAVQVAGNPSAAVETDHLASELFSLYARQSVFATIRPERHFRQVSERPRANALARQQAAFGLGHVAGPRHITLHLDPITAHLLLLLDGSRDRDELVEALDQAVGEQEALRALLGDAVASDPVKRLRLVRENITRMLALLARQGILLS